MGNFFQQKREQFGFAPTSPPVERTIIAPTDDEVAQELKRIQELVSQSKASLQDEKYEQIDL